MTLAEINALVATHVFRQPEGDKWWTERPHDWRRGTDDERCEERDVEYGVEKRCGCTVDVCRMCGAQSCVTMGWHKPASPTCERKPPAYSSDIAEAWTVVEEMLNRGYTFSCDKSGRGFHAVLYRHWNGKNELREAIDPSAPRAICLAALKSLGVHP